ncbi:hypothetical protein QFZ70_002616 [Arthrobacter sp. V1I9]|uniref:hypothetical protein n=1 Tax=Arthrobacter sp. V1I9 TaxID=3042275 RepID=UPI002793E7EC|nr:hypothetical protein [Arthrobacter sp. V1I9]MDQ0870143.1 hypothetical protein [Arthrobacter sp. V1I9]
MGNASEWAVRRKAFHEKQLDRPRKVYRIGRTKLVVTGGQAASTVGAAVATASVDSPSWLFLGAVAAGFFGGKYLYPIPRSNVAARRGSSAVTRKSPHELDSMTPAEIRAYQFNIEFTHKEVTPSALGTEEALGRQAEAVRTVSPVVGANAELLNHLSLTDVQEFGRTAARHDLLKRRWLSYEVDPQKQFDYPAMSDASSPATAAMIRAMRAADQARTAGNPADYKPAVDRFSQALQAAEQAAGVP